MNKVSQFSQLVFQLSNLINEKFYVEMATQMGKLNVLKYDFIMGNDFYYGVH